MGFYRLLSRANQWNSIRVRVRPPSIRQTVAKVWRESPQNTTWRPSETHAQGRLLILLLGAARRLLPLGGRPQVTSSGRKNPNSDFMAICPAAVRRYGTSSSTQISRDVVLFQHDRTSFARLLATFCAAQTVFWTYLAHFAYTGLRDDSGTLKEPRKVTTTTNSPPRTGLAWLWGFEVNLGSTALRYGFTAGCLAVGAGILGGGVLFCRRSVSRVTLHKGGKMVTVATLSPLGNHRGRRITVPLARVACHAHRNESPSFVPLKIKDHRFYFLLNNEGTINNVKLFDVTVGAYRPL